MLKRVLVVLQGSDGDVVVERMIGAVAGKGKVQVDALTILDEASLCSRVAVPMGALQYKKATDERCIADARARLKRSGERFIEACRRFGVEASVYEVTGRARKVMADHWHHYDLVLLGREKPGTGTAMFPARQLMNLLRDCPRPMVVATHGPAQRGETVAIAYDGSPQANRSLHLFLLLGLADGRRLEVVTIHRDRAAAAAIADRAVRLCEAHGHVAAAYPVATGSQRLPVLMAHLERLKPGFVVAGGFGAGLWRKLFYGSRTARLIARSRSPIFLHN